MNKNKKISKLVMVLVTSKTLMRLKKNSSVLKNNELLVGIHDAYHCNKQIFLKFESRKCLDTLKHNNSELLRYLTCDTNSVYLWTKERLSGKGLVA